MGCFSELKQSHYRERPDKKAAVCLLFTPLTGDCDNIATLVTSTARETFHVAINLLSTYSVQDNLSSTLDAAELSCKGGFWNKHTEGKPDQGYIKLCAREGRIKPNLQSPCSADAGSLTILLYTGKEYVRTYFSFCPKEFFFLM